MNKCNCQWRWIFNLRIWFYSKMVIFSTRLFKRFYLSIISFNVLFSPFWFQILQVAFFMRMIKFDFIPIFDCWKKNNQLVLYLAGDLHSIKPLTPNAKFSKNHFMNMSLFERLMNNGFHCHHLKIQRKTPPEINSVLRSTFVTDLYSDVAPNGVGLPKVKGLGKNVFFLNNNLAQRNVSNLAFEKYLFFLILFLYFVFNVFIFSGRCVYGKFYFENVLVFVEA